MLLKKVTLIFVFVIAQKCLTSNENCLNLTILSPILSSNCESSNSDSLTEYKISFNKLTSFLNWTYKSLIQIKPIDENQTNIQLIQQLSIRNQNLIKLNTYIIDTSLRLLELELKNDSIESISVLALSNLVYLRKLSIHGNPIKSIDLAIISQLKNLEVLNLTENGLDSIYLNIGKTIHVKELYLDKNSLINLGDFSYFPDLTKIGLSSNLIKRITNQTFFNLTNLEILDFNSNLISFIETNAFTNLTNLQELHLANNYLTQIDAFTFVGLSNLKQLEITGNKIEEIKSHAFVSVGLEYFYLTYQKLKSIEKDAFWKCEKLSAVYIHSNQFKRIPLDFFGNLASSLKTIFLSNNLLEEVFYNNFGENDHLETLSFERNFINTIEAGSFIYLNLLQILSFADNFLREIHSEMFIGLVEVLQLDLNGNKLTSISSYTFRHLPKLEYLDLSNNYIRLIEPYAFAELFSLYQLQIDDNQLAEITPMTFKGLVNLTNLFLDKNKIAFILKHSFYEIESLETLRLNTNQLGLIDSGVFDGLESLRSIHLENNRIESINGMFKNLTNIEIVVLSSNLLRRIDPNTFAGLKYLRYLDLSENPLDQFIGHDSFDQLGSTLERLSLRKISSNPSDFLRLSLFVKLNYFDVSGTKFRLNSNSLDTFAISISFLYMRQIDMNELTFLPMEKMINLIRFDISDNLINWLSFCNGTNRLFRHHPTMKEVFLSNTSLNELEYLNLGSLKSLDILDLSQNQIESINIDDIIICNRLILTNNRIKYIQPGWFDYIRDLRELSLGGNQFADNYQISEINLRFFFSLYALDLSNSNIREIPLFNWDQTEQVYANSTLSSLTGGYRLNILKLAHNRIESIGSEHFYKLNNLISLDLAYNHISIVRSSDVFYGSPKLEYLNLSSNEIDTLALRKLNLNLCNSLKHLNLSQNRINLLQSFMFDDLKKLVIIDLSYNEIIRIESNTFHNLIKLKELFIESFGTKQVVSIKENFTSECVMLKIVHVSSIELVQFNLHAFISSLKAISTNKIVNDAVYFNSINIVLDNFDYYKSDRRLACELTIKLLRNRIHLNLMDDFGFIVFMEYCYSLDIFDDLI